MLGIAGSLITALWLTTLLFGWARRSGLALAGAVLLVVSVIARGPGTPGDTSRSDGGSALLCSGRSGDDGILNACKGRSVRTRTPIVIFVLCACALVSSAGRPAPAVRNVSIQVDTRMDAPRWARLERQLLDENVPACREFYRKYFDNRGYLQCFVRWGANDGPDDAFENFNRWPELHALGASDEILRMFLKGHDGLISAFTVGRTSTSPSRAGPA